MGYHNKDNVQKNYDRFIDRTCDICNEYSSTNPDEIEQLKKQSNLHSNNYKLCVGDKNALLLSFTNYRSDSEKKAQDFQSQIDGIETELSRSTVLLNTKSRVLQDCNDHKDNITAHINELRVNLQELDANNTDCHNSLQSKVDENKRIKGDKDVLEDSYQDLQSDLELKKQQKDKCEEEKQELVSKDSDAKNKLEELQDNFDKISQEKEDISTRLALLESDIKICQENLGKGCKEVEDNLKSEVTRLENELSNVRIELNHCSSNLTKTTEDKDILTNTNISLSKELSDKRIALEECQNDLKKINDKSETLKQKVEELTQKVNDQEAECLLLKESKAILDARNKTLTVDFNECKGNLSSSNELLSNKEERIVELSDKISRLETEKENYKVKLLEAKQNKMEGYKASCDLMHERYQNYYDGETSHKSFFDKLIDHFISSWFSTRYSDTKLIW